MSGHSKWSTIKRQKGLKDIKRGQAFTKLSNAITIAVKQGGGVIDPNSNFRLRLAIDAARNSNMPKENIDRAIQKASGGKEGSLEEVLYEGFAPFGVSVIVEAATDNSLRTTSEVKNLFNKSGGSFGQPGSVSYQFKHVGRITLDKNKSFDDVFNVAVENGAEDIGENDDEYIVYTPVSSLGELRDILSNEGVGIISAELYWKPVVPSLITEDEKLQRIAEFVESLEEMDDVQKVYTNIA